MNGTVDLYQGQGKDLLSPASRCAAITPSDSSSLPVASKAIYVGATGNVKLLAVDDTVPVTFTGVPVGTVLHVRAQQVYATGTTATSLIALI
jgi:hypothetical protein